MAAITATATTTIIYPELSDDPTPLSWAMWKFIDETTTPQQFDNEVKRLQDESKITFNITSGARCGHTVMHRAACVGNVKLIEHLYKLGGNRLLNMGDYDGVTPLYIAVCAQQVEAVRVLLELGANAKLAVHRTSGDSECGDLAENTTPLWKALNHPQGVNSEIVALLQKY